ncbi:MAG: DoxX family protein [bacterium]|nr:DoxX family protein [bacterium]
MDFLNPFRPQLYAILRIVTGFLFLWHGSQKLFGWPGGAPEGAPAFIIYVAGPIELLGGLLLIAGFLVRPAAFLCSGLMAFAYWLGHGTNAVLPLMNGGELSMLYCFLFLFIAAEGAGIWSVDGTRNAA